MNKADSSMYAKVISANDLHDNGATVLMGGTIDASGTVTQSLGKAILGAGSKQPSGVVESAHVGTTNANDAGTFAKQTAGNYIVKGGDVTATLAGVAYRGLRGGGNQNQVRGIHSLVTRHTVKITAWNYATGAATKATGTDDNFGASYVDPTRALPGNLVINYGDGAVVKAYQEKVA